MAATPGSTGTNPVVFFDLTLGGELLLFDFLMFLWVWL